MGLGEQICRPRSMVEHAWNWARDNGHLRQNPIHGEEEINVVLEEYFDHAQQQGKSMTQSGSFAMEDISTSQRRSSRILLIS